MPYQEETIKTILDRLNTQYFLPSIQRDFVWKPEQIILLFDSIMRGYPISSFLFWELTQENKDKWEVYKFCEEANTNSTRHIRLTSALGIQSLTLILDGQQRLTSIAIGLKGLYRIRKKGQWWADPKYYLGYHLYLDMFADPVLGDGENEFTGKPYYSFAWHEKVPQNDNNHWWFRVGRILDCHNDNEYYMMREAEEMTFPEGVTKVQENIFERNFWRLYEAIYKDAAISYYVERDQDYDRVLDIFVRANEAGTELNKAQIITSMFESKWEGGAKEKINRLIDQVNNYLPRRNNITLEFIMRTCLVLADMPVRYRINNFTNHNISRIEELWPDIQDAILRTLTLVNKFGIDRTNLTSLNALIPLVLYVFRNPGKSFLGTTLFDVQNAVRMRHWLVLALLNRIFGRGAEQVLSSLRNVINKFPAGENFPAPELNGDLERMRFRMRWDEISLQEYLNSGYPVDFFKISLLYDDHFWDGQSMQQDHIFPKSLFEPKNQLFSSLTPEKQANYLQLFNRIGNLELLNEQENNEKKAKPFDKWLATRDISFRRRHLIPEDDESLQYERFDDFIAAREKLISARLNSII